MWRIGRQDVEDYIDQAYRRTAERIAAGEVGEDMDASEAILPTDWSRKVS